MSDLCKGKTGTDAAHCWHGTGRMFLSMPPVDELRCCFCGEIKTVRLEDVLHTGIHGPFMPSNAGGKPT